MTGNVAILETLARENVANLENAQFFGARYCLEMLSSWLRNALEISGISQAELSRELSKRLGKNIDRAAVNKMINGHRTISGDEMLAISAITGVTMPHLGSKSNIRILRVIAHVQAGYWGESWEWPYDDQYEVAVPVDPALEGVQLFAAETRGPSMNKRWPEGTVVIFTDAIKTEESPIPGKRYVVERIRADGMKEHTVKLLHRDENGKFWLIPESTDPLHQTPISVEDGDGGHEVRIVGRVCYAVTRE